MPCVLAKPNSSRAMTTLEDSFGATAPLRFDNQYYLEVEQVKNHGDDLLIMHQYNVAKSRHRRACETGPEDILERHAPTDDLVLAGFSIEWPCTSGDSWGIFESFFGWVKRTIDRKSYEQIYQKIGWWKGPLATAEAQRSLREYWVDRGTAGAEWLVDRIGSETHGDLLDGIANLLADIGPKSIVPIARKLEDEPTRDQAEVLLKSLGWIEATHDDAAVHPHDLWTILGHYLSDADADIRIAACAATRILPRHRRLSLLSQRRPFEHDPEVLDAIDEAAGD
jgi:hypothetical protein